MTRLLDSAERIVETVIAVSAIAFVVGWLSAGAVVWLGGRMSRSGYSDDCDGWALIRWRGAVNSALCGKRGQAFLREMLTALDALPEKKLITGELEWQGQVCAMGAVGRLRGMTHQSALNPDDREEVAKAFGIAPALAAEIAYLNDDEGSWLRMTDEERWTKMRAWVVEHIA